MSFILFSENRSGSLYPFEDRCIFDHTPLFLSAFYLWQKYPSNECINDSHTGLALDPFFDPSVRQSFGPSVLQPFGPSTMSSLQRKLTNVQARRALQLKRMVQHQLKSAFLIKWGVSFDTFSSVAFFTRITTLINPSARRSINNVNAAVKKRIIDTDLGLVDFKNDVIEIMEACDMKKDKIQSMIKKIEKRFGITFLDRMTMSSQVLFSSFIEKSPDEEDPNRWSDNVAYVSSRKSTSRQSLCE